MRIALHSWAGLGAAAAVLSLSSPLPAAEPSLAEVEHQFQTLPPEARRHTGPLFWLHGDESRARLETELAKVAEGGNGSFTAESRPHSDWLGEGWFRDLGICLEAARKLDLQMWIFDEKWWPSGEVGGKVPVQFGSKRMVATATNVIGPAHFTIPLLGSNLIAVVAGRDTGQGLDAASLVDLTPSVKEGQLAWEAPAGAWKLMRFSWKPQLSGSRYLLDGASQDAVDWYIRTVYQPHYDRFPTEFGRHIAGYFYDEPETHGDWGTEVLKLLAERQVDWKKALVAWKFPLAGEDQAAAKYQYHDAFAEAWGRTLYGGLTRWCEAHHVVSMGHFLEHGNGYVNQNICAGNMFQLQKYSGLGALDAVFDQFVWGKRVTRDAPIWQTPKLASSITHAYGKSNDVSMVEIFGARGQDLTYPEMKWWADHMQVSGVNFLIPHSFNPRGPRDTDCPPYFYNGGFEPRYPLYRVFADYTSRLALLLTGGHHVCPVALLYLGNSVHVGQARLPEQVSEALQDALFDCDWIPYEVLENDMRVAGKELRLRQESYKVLLVPPAEVIPYATLVKIREFFEAGGVVAGHGFLPTKSATLGRTAQEIAALREAVWGTPAQPGLAACKTSPAGGRSYLLPEKPTPEELQQALTGDAGVHPTLEVVAGQTDHWLHVLHRVKAGHDVFLICNQNHLGDARKFRVRLTASGEPECWDPMRHEITALPSRRVGPAVELDLTLQPSESVVVVFQDQKRPLPPRLEPDAPAPAQTIVLTRDRSPAVPEPELDAQDESQRVFAGGAWVWYPEGNPARSAPPGTRYFRKQITLPAGRALKGASFLGTADNSFVLFVNGQAANPRNEDPEGWRVPAGFEVTRFLRPGLNQLAVSALNATTKPSPAGFIGRLRVEFEQGEPLVVRVDATWKAANLEQEGWLEAGFDDHAWPAALEVARFGGAPWGGLGGGLTLSPVKADPFDGHCEIPAAPPLIGRRIYLELDTVQPEAAARVTVNGQDAGGFIERPLRLDITSYAHAGNNTFRLEPFAPKSARVVIR